MILLSNRLYGICHSSLECEDSGLDMSLLPVLTLCTIMDIEQGTDKLAEGSEEGMP